MRLAVLVLVVLVGGCGSSGGGYEGAGNVVDAQVETGGSGDGGMAGAPTGGSGDDGGATASAGAPTGGSEPAGGATGGSEPAGGTGGSSEPACTAAAALTGVPPTFTWEGWEARDSFADRCAGCASSPCATAEVNVEVMSPSDPGAILFTLTGFTPTLVGGPCGTQASSCAMTGTGEVFPDVSLRFTPMWSGEAWTVVVDESNPNSWVNPQCYVEGGDFEPWSRSSMLDDLEGELADWLEAVEWPCP